MCTRKGARMLSPHTSEGGIIKKTNRKHAAEDLEKLEHCALLMGMYYYGMNGTVAWQILQKKKIKNRITLQSSNSTLGHILKSRVLHRHLYTIFINIIKDSPKRETTQMFID